MATSSWRARLASPYLLLALSNLLWAGNWTISRAFRAELPPVALSFWRWVLALACLLPFAWPHVRRDWPALKASWRWLLVFGALGTGGYNALAYIGVQYTTVINGSLLNSFSPVMIVLISWLGFGRKLHAREAAGIAISLLGVLGIIAHGEPARLLDLSFNVGDLWVLASVLAWSLYTLFLPHRPQVHALSFLFAISVTGLLFLLPFYGVELAGGRRIVLTPASLACIAYTGIFPAVVGYILWNRGVAQVGPAKAGLFLHLLPAFAIVLSALFLNELPALYHLAGIALILLGIWLNTRRFA